MSFAWQLSSCFDVCFVWSEFANPKYYKWCTNDEIRDTKLLERKGKTWLVNKRTTEKGAHISFQRFNIYSRAETKEDEPCPAREQFVIFSCDQVVSVPGPLDKSSLSWILKWRTVNNVTVSWSLWNVFLLVILFKTLS